MPGKGVVVLAETVSSQDAFVQLPSRPSPRAGHRYSRAVSGRRKWPDLRCPQMAGFDPSTEGEYLSGIAPISPDTAWKHVYRLLLWIDSTTGLAQCYESDKSQPGRPWYERSLRFHRWVAESLGSTPGDLRSKIDWLLSVPRRSSLPALHRDGKRGPAAREHERQGCRNQGEIQNWRTLFLMPLHLGCRNRPPSDTMRQLRTLTEIILLCAERQKPQKTGSARMHLATLYRSRS